MPSPNLGSDLDAPHSPSDVSAQPVQPQPASPAPSTSSGPPFQPVVSNTTPLISLGEIGLLDVLRQLYGTVIIPSTVLTEYQRGCAAHPQQPDLQGVFWVTVLVAPTDPLVPSSLDAGGRSKPRGSSSTSGLRERPPRGWVWP